MNGQRNICRSIGRVEWVDRERDQGNIIVCNRV